MPLVSRSRRTAAVLLALVTVLAVAAPTVATASADAQPDGDEIIEQIEQRYGDAETVVGSAVLTTSNETGTVEANVSFAFAQPDNSRIVVERDDTSYQVGSNGTVNWMDGPQGAAVWEAGDPEGPAVAAGATSGLAVGDVGVPAADDAGLLANDSALAWLTPTDVDAENVDVTLVGTTEIDGVPAYELDVAPVEGESAVTTLWVAQDDYRVLRVASTTDSRLTVVDVEEVRFDADVHESTFEPPEERADAAAIDTYESFDDVQAATDLDLPQIEGATFQNATVTGQQNETFVAQEYDVDGDEATLVSTTDEDRLAPLTLNASDVDVDDRNASAAQVGGGSVVFWTDDGVTTAVVVEDSTDRAVEIADQVTE